MIHPRQLARRAPRQRRIRGALQFPASRGVRCRWVTLGGRAWHSAAPGIRERGYYHRGGGPCDQCPVAPRSGGQASGSRAGFALGEFVGVESCAGATLWTEEVLWGELVGKPDSKVCVLRTTSAGVPMTLVMIFVYKKSCNPGLLLLPISNTRDLAQTSGFSADAPIIPTARTMTVAMMPMTTSQF